MLSVQSRSSIPRTRKGLPLTAPSRGPSSLPPLPARPVTPLSACPAACRRFQVPFPRRGGTDCKPGGPVGSLVSPAQQLWWEQAVLVE